MSFYEELIKDSVRKRAKEFWGAFIDLNEVNYSSPESFLEIQKNNLREIEKSRQMNYSMANKFLQEVNKKNIKSPLQDGEWVSKSDLISRIIAIINSAFWSNKNSPYQVTGYASGNTSNLKASLIQSNEIIVQEHNELIALLDTLLGQGNVLNAEIVKAFDERVQYSSIVNGYLQRGFQKDMDYVNIKAGLVESLMEQALADSGLKTINTAKWFDKTNKMAIQDTLSFSNRSLGYTGKNGFLHAEINGQDMAFKTLGDFINAVENFAKKASNVKVTLNDELQDIIERTAVLGGQAKSGFGNQDILNSSGADARNSTTFQKIGLEFAGLDLTLALFDIDIAIRAEGHHGWFKEESEQNSEIIEAYANYFLSKSILETNITKNQVYLTKDGFTTASDWMDTHNKYLKFKTGEANSISADFWNKQRTYSF